MYNSKFEEEEEQGFVSRKIRESSSKSTILTSVLSGIGMFAGIPPELSIAGATGIITLLPNSWFD